MTVLDLLKAARASLTEYTWGQGHGLIGPPNDLQCVVTIMAKFDPQGSKSLIATNAIEDEIQAPVMEWNDTPGRTLAQVHAAFDAAIAKLEAEAHAQ